VKRQLVTRQAVLGLGVLGLLGLATGTAGGSNAAATRPTGSITVFAASSLTEAFTRLGREFERRHPGTTVTLSLNGSPALANQIREGAPADVFASADTETMQSLVDDRAIAGRPIVFARNRLEIAVEPDNPLRIGSLADTRRDGVTLVLCAPTVPCGAYARASYAKAGVRIGTVPTAESAKATITRVVLGEADAAVVYATDVEAAGRDVAGVAIADRNNVVASYPIGVVRDSSNPRLARAFVDEVVSVRGQRTLRRYGFVAP
jgi:molybdate transport system substrate-binding protein